MQVPRRIGDLIDPATLIQLDRTRRRLTDPIEKAVAAPLERDILSRPRPHSLGIIMDGNRRWARRIGAPPWMGHRHGKEKIRELMRWCKRFDIRTLVLYAFSAENFGRRTEEVDQIMALMKEGFTELATDPLITREGIRVRVIGDLSLLPPDVQQAIRTVEDISSDHDNYHLTFAIAYGGRDEITHAVRTIAEKASRGEIDPSTVDESTVQSHLYTGDLDDPDLIIRTSGEKRLSNFLPWQSVYAELHFTHVLWPAFSYLDFLRALRSYQTRERRIGR
jgi:tritrans,polycis-undecaprenyl-diphosphate synthase [geranylgeranyl-diphosphate specific]